MSYLSTLVMNKRTHLKMPIGSTVLIRENNNNILISHHSLTDVIILINKFNVITVIAEIKIIIK